MALELVDDDETAGVDGATEVDAGVDVAELDLPGLPLDVQALSRTAVSTSRAQRCA